MAQGGAAGQRRRVRLTIDNVALAVLSLILVVPLGSAYMAYRAHKETEALRSDVERLEGELAYWRDTGGRLMEGLVRDQEKDIRGRPGSS